LVLKRTEEDELLLQAMKDTQDKRMFQRYQVVFMYKKGYSVRDIHGISQLSEKTIYTYIRAYEQSGLEGLSIGTSPGAPRKLTADQENRLIQLITSKQPDELALADQPKWTLKLVSALIEREFNQTYTLRGTSKLLQDLGLVYSDPKTAPAGGDPKKKNRPHRTIRLPTVFLVHKPQTESDSHLRFIENTLQLYPTGRIALMLNPEERMELTAEEELYELMYYHPIGRP